MYVELQIVKMQYTCNCGRVVCINDVNKIKKKKSARHKYQIRSMTHFILKPLLF